jgi:hypothetical protein
MITIIYAASRMRNLYAQVALADTLLAGNYYISDMIKRKDDRNMGTYDIKWLSSEENRTRQGVRNPNY